MFRPGDKRAAGQYPPLPWAEPMALKESVNCGRANTLLSRDQVQPSSAARDYGRVQTISAAREFHQVQTSSALSRWLQRLPNHDLSTPALLLYFGTLSLPFTILALVISIRKPLGNDELFTLYIA